MSSFAQNGPRQYKEYVPEVNDQVYAQALGKKDQEYQLGAQKVENYRNSIAGIPVAFEHERKYLQNVTDQLTTQINEMVGTDWSDQKMVNQIGNQANAISNDDNIQTAIANASKVREQQGRMKTDDKQAKGANVANRYNYLDSLNKFAGQAKVGDSFNGMYHEYFDKQKYTDDYFAKKHPNQEVRYEFAGFDANGNPKSQSNIYEWDAIKHTYKGLRPDEIAREMQELLSTSPELENQLAIDAKYKYRNTDAIGFGKEISNHQLASVDRDSKLYSNKLQSLSNYKQGDPEYIQITKDLEDLSTDATKRLKYLKDGLPVDMYNYHTNEGVRDALNGKLYIDKWVNAQADFYSWGENNIELIGDSPRKAWYEKQKLSLENRKLTDEEKHKSFQDNLDMLKYQDSHMLTGAKIDKLKSSITGSSNGPISLADMGVDMNKQTQVGPYEKTKQDVINTDNTLENKKYNYMHDVLGKYSGDLFIRKDDGNYIPKDEDSKNLVNKYHDDLKTAYTKGGLGKDGKPLLDEADKDYFSSIAEDDVHRDLTLQNLDRGNKLWEKEVTNNPAIQQVYSTLKQMDNMPLQVNGHIITGNNIETYEANKDKVEAISEKINEAKESGVDASNIDSLTKQRDALLNSMGLDLPKYNTIQQGTAGIGAITEKLEALPTKRVDFLNKHVSGGVDEGVIYNNQQSVGMFGLDPKRNNFVKRNIVQIAQRMGDKYKPLSTDPNKFQIAYTQDPDTKKFSVLIQDPTKAPADQLPPIPLTNNEVANLQLKDITTIDPEMDRISKNWDAGKNTGNPNDGGMKFENGFHTGIVTSEANVNNGHPTEIRYHVEKKSTGFYVTLFGKDQKTGQVSRITQLPKQKDWGTAKMKLNQLLKRNEPQNQGFSVDPTIENNTNKNLTEESTNSIIEEE